MQSYPPEIQAIRQTLHERKVRISAKTICETLARVDSSQQDFPMIQQRALLVRLLRDHRRLKRKVIFHLEELGEGLPKTVILGALAEDWPGMSNSILGIVHKREQNVSFIKGFTVREGDKTIGIVILSYRIEGESEFARYQEHKKELTARIREASVGSGGKRRLLEEETVKVEIFNSLIRRIERVYRQPDIEQLTGKNGEVIKFFASRSREYLEERSVADLARLILTNHRFQKAISSGKADRRIDVANFITRYERLTGITFACRETNFSIEDFLKSLEFIVPGHVIKYHKSFVNAEGILVYRIEIVDNNGQPLTPEAIRSIKISLDKLISTSANENVCQVKSVGGFEHYARAIIPFLMDERAKTGFPQVFLSVGNKTEFVLAVKMILVTSETSGDRLQTLIRLLERNRGVEIISVVPPKIYRRDMMVDLLNLRIRLADFPTIPAVYTCLREALRKVYGAFRDFDEGLRSMDLRTLDELTASLPKTNPLLVREIFYNLDELYRIETPQQILHDTIQLCCATAKYLRHSGEKRPVISYRHLRHPLTGGEFKTVFIISYLGERSILNQIVRDLDGIELYFTRITWDQRSYLILILKKDNRALTPEQLSRVIGQVLLRRIPKAVVLLEAFRHFFDRC